ncbi:hypothetical protein KAR34_12750 [bacterium]|nr:hypothetical protein [bacterium]
MPYCPKCGYEYQPDINTCPDCNEQLVAFLPPDPNQGELFETVQLCKVPDEITGMALQSLLRDAGIDANLRDMRASFYGSVLSNMQGFWGTIIVYKKDEKKAQKLYATFQKDFQGK